ncbi:MAG: IS3 family transposase, partial [Tepidibacter sp.]|uniref:HTH domain-containing protein n=1 Tax=Tepidibacter sp. TaxID=2529387 RepID=UPI002ED38E76|nr:IS3 family transposase [Tepidibacter sp.]
MSNKIFTEKEIKILSRNQYIKRVGMKGINYTDEFKRIFISEYEKGRFPRDIFEEYRFD